MHLSELFFCFSAKIYKRKVPHEAIRLFGKEFQLKLCELLCSDGLKAIDELKAIHGEVCLLFVINSFCHLSFRNRNFPERTKWFCGCCSVAVGRVTY